MDDPVRALIGRWRDDPGGGRLRGRTHHVDLSGIVRLPDLALSGDFHATAGLFLVAPDDREGEVLAQLSRPAFSRVGDLTVRFLPRESSSSLK